MYRDPLTGPIQGTELSPTSHLTTGNQTNTNNENVTLVIINDLLHICLRQYAYGICHCSVYILTLGYRRYVVCVATDGKLTRYVFTCWQLTQTLMRFELCLPLTHFLASTSK